MNIEKLMVNEGLRTLTRNAGLCGSRRVLLSTLMPLVAPPWKRARLRKRMLGYLTEFFPEYDRTTAERLANQFVHHWCSKHAEDLYAINLPDLMVVLEQIDRLVLHEKRERFNEALEHGTGILAVGSHVGAVTFGTIALLSRLRETTPTQRPLIRICADPEMNRYPSVFEGAEHALRYFERDVRYIITGREKRPIAVEMAEALERGAFVTTNMDVMMGGADRRPFDLFGRARVQLPALVGAAKVALRTGATILPWICTRTVEGFRLRLERPIGPVPRLGVEVPADHPALLDLTETLRDTLEGWIRWHPEQWTYWDRMHRRRV